MNALTKKPLRAERTDPDTIKLYRGADCIGMLLRRPGGWVFREHIIGAIASSEVYPLPADAAHRRWGDEARTAVSRL